MNTIFKRYNTTIGGIFVETDPFFEVMLAMIPKK